MKYKKLFGANHKSKLILVRTDSITGKTDSFSHETVTSVNDKTSFMSNEKSEGEQPTQFSNNFSFMKFLKDSCSFQLIVFFLDKYFIQLFKVTMLSFLCRVTLSLNADLLLLK